MNIGGGEILLLLILGLIMFGPKRLPEIGRQVGRALGELRRVSQEFEREVRDAAEPLADEIRQAEAEARKTYALDDDFSTFKPRDPGPSSPEKE